MPYLAWFFDAMSGVKKLPKLRAYNQLPNFGKNAASKRFELSNAMDITINIRRNINV